MSKHIEKLIEIRYILSDALEEIKAINHTFSEALMETHIEIIDNLIATGGDEYLDDLANNLDTLIASEPESQLQ